MEKKKEGELNTIYYLLSAIADCCSIYYDTKWNLPFTREEKRIRERT